MAEELTRFTYMPLVGKRILLGLTGSSAVYRSIDLARRLIRMGAVVKVVMSKASTRFIGVDLVHWATGYKPYVEMSGETEHIDLASWADAMLIAPATLNALSKIVAGVADELIYLTAVTLMGGGKMIIAVPTMNIRLYKSPQYVKAEREFMEMGGLIIPPFIEEDKVKFPPIDDLSHCVDAMINRSRELAGKRVLVTAGPTVEHIDPVRVITNPSSGLMGVMMAREFACRGAIVDLVHGPLGVQPPYMVTRHPVETTAEMASKVEELTGAIEYDAAVFAAAPADYTPTEKHPAKISTRERPELTLRLVKTVKVVSRIGKRPRVLVGFAAETEGGDALVRRAVEKASEYGFDLVVANNVASKGAGFGSEYLDVAIVESGKTVVSGVVNKALVARYVADYVEKKLRD